MTQFCQSCGAESAVSYRFCPRCGNTTFASAPPQIARASASVSAPSLAPSQRAKLQYQVGNLQYVGFWRRGLAIAIDFLLLASPWALFDQLVTYELFGTVDLVTWGLASVLAYLYSALLESSSWQATVGKRLLGMKVCDATTGARISFWQASGRHLASYLSAILLLGGYFMAAFTSRRQTLHDIIANTLVLMRKE